MKTFTLKYIVGLYKEEAVVTGQEIEKINTDAEMTKYQYINSDGNKVAITFPSANFISLEEIETKSVVFDEVKDIAEKRKKKKLKKTTEIAAQTTAEVIEEACTNFNVYQDPHLMLVVCKYLAQQERAGIYTLIRYQLPNFRAQVYARCEGRSVQPRLSEFRTLGKWLAALAIDNVDDRIGDSTFRLLHEMNATPRPIMKHFEESRPNMIAMVRGYKAESTDSLSQFI